MWRWGCRPLRQYLLCYNHHCINHTRKQPPITLIYLVYLLTINNLFVPQHSTASHHKSTALLLYCFLTFFSSFSSQSLHPHTHNTHLLFSFHHAGPVYVEILPLKLWIWRHFSTSSVSKSAYSHQGMANSVVSQSDDEFEDLQSHRFDDSYSLSADVSESESSTSSAATFSSDHRLRSACAALSPLNLASNSECLPPPPIMLPVVGGRHVIFPAEKSDEGKHEPLELSGEFPAFNSVRTNRRRFGLTWLNRGN